MTKKSAGSVDDIFALSYTFKLFTAGVPGHKLTKPLEIGVATRPRGKRVEYVAMHLLPCVGNRIVKMMATAAEQKWPPLKL